jgi:hypothetical protein
LQRLLGVRLPRGQRPIKYVGDLHRHRAIGAFFLFAGGSPSHLAAAPRVASVPRGGQLTPGSAAKIARAPRPRELRIVLCRRVPRFDRATRRASTEPLLWRLSRAPRRRSATTERAALACAAITKVCRRLGANVALDRRARTLQREEAAVASWLEPLRGLRARDARRYAERQKTCAPLSLCHQTRLCLCCARFPQLPPKTLGCDR